MNLFIAALPSILLSAYSSLVIKWRVAQLAVTTAHSMGRIERTITYLCDPYIISAYTAALLSSFAWFYVAERHPVSIALPVYIGVLFCIVTVGSTLLLKESISAQSLIGLGLIFTGVVVISRSVTS